MYVIVKDGKYLCYDSGLAPFWAPLSRIGYEASSEGWVTSGTHSLWTFDTEKVAAHYAKVYEAQHRRW